MNDLIVPTARTVPYINSFLPSTIREWNSLDESVRNSPVLNTFEFQINRKSEIRTYPEYFDVIHTMRVGQIYHASLRLECSSLKHHLFNKTVVADPICSCGAVESTSHCLLTCDNYRNLRIRNPSPIICSKTSFRDPGASFDENSFIFRFSFQNSHCLAIIFNSIQLGLLCFTLDPVEWLGSFFRLFLTLFYTIFF